MTRLILAGGGDAPDSKPLDDLFRSFVKDKKVLYIPIAWKGGNFDVCKDWFRSTFPGFNIEMCTDLKSMDDLQGFGGIYIGGGNTFSLLHELRATGFDRKLLGYIKAGNPVYGGSAGAIIFGRSIYTAEFGSDPDENEVGIEDLSGLNLVKEYSVQCHYKQEQDNELLKCESVIAISERSGLFVEEGIKVIGFEPAYVFKKGKKKEYPVGSMIS